MTPCRQFDHIAYKLKCATGRHAPRDCRSCPAYDPAAEPASEADRLRHDAWLAMIGREKQVNA